MACNRGGPLPALADVVWEDFAVRRLLCSVAVMALGVTAFWAADKPQKDTPSAAKTRQRLKQKISVEFKDTRMKDAFEDIRRQLENRVSFRLDNEGGVSNNSTVTFKADDQPAEKVLGDFCTKFELGYVVISKEKDRYDGWVLIKKGKERGYPAGAEVAKDGDSPNDKPEVKPKDKAAAAKDKPKVKPKDKDKPAIKDKPESSPDKDEEAASSKLSLAKSLAKDGKTDRARERLEDIIKMYPDTQAAKEAADLLKKLKKK
jgi:hypothetical protein